MVPSAVCRGNCDRNFCHCEKSRRLTTNWAIEFLELLYQIRQISIVSSRIVKTTLRSARAQAWQLYCKKSVQILCNDDDDDSGTILERYLSGKNEIQLALGEKVTGVYKGVLLHTARKEVTHTWFVHLPKVLSLSC